MIAFAIIVAVVACLVAFNERNSAGGIQLAFRHHLMTELHDARVRVRQLEYSLDAVRAGALDIAGPEQRDGHLIVSAPGLMSLERSDNPATPAITSVALSIDTLPEPLRSEVRALEGDDTQREYLELIQRELANGADVDALYERLFAV